MGTNSPNFVTELNNDALGVFDFSKCVLCQELSTEQLVNSKTVGRQSLCDNLKEFVEFKTTAVSRQMYNVISDHQQIKHFINNDNVKYHKTCKNSYHPIKLAQLIERESCISKRPTDQNETGSSTNLRKRSRQNDDTLYCCLLCNSYDTDENFSTVSKLETIEKMYQQAVRIEDEVLKSKFFSINTLPENWKYHKACYSRFLRSKQAGFNTEEHEASSNYNIVYDMALNELVTTMKQDFVLNSVDPQLYKLSELCEGIANRLKEFGYEKPIHSTRVKDKLIEILPELRCVTIGREVRLFFNKDVGKFLEKSSNDRQSDDMILIKASNILRNAMFAENQPIFHGSFEHNFKAENTVSKTLVTFIQTLLEPNTNSKIYESDLQKNSLNAENIAQLIKFNSLKYRKQNDNMQNRHSVLKEQPLPLYIGLLLHSCTQQRYIVDEINRLGICVSYSRVLEIESAMTSKICQIYSIEDTVCPPNLVPKIFTTAAMDNIDHNPMSTSANYAFHGTGISIIQHYNDSGAESQYSYIELEKSDFSRGASSSMPSSYYNVPPLATKTGEVHVATVNWNTESLSSNPLDFVNKWLMSSKRADHEDCVDKIISWSAYNSRLQNQESSKFRSTSTMLPLLKDDINSPAVVRHAMDIIIAAIHKLNPDQVPVITADLPVFVIAKQIQLNLPSKYGEDKIVLMQGGLHIEMSFIAVIGTWLEGSGWDEIMSKAGLTTPLRALAILKSSHVKRSRYAHEVSLTALNILLYKKFCTEYDHIDGLDEEDEYTEWILEKCATSPQYQYWVTVMKLQALLLRFIKCTREANFEGYFAVLENMCPWYIVTHHHNYARWLPVFIKTLKQLPTQHPDVYEQFKKGHFTSRKTNKRFSCISDDHLHEQNNKLVKGNGTILSSLDDESKLAKWLISGPEIARLLAEYQNLSILEKGNDRHHEDNLAFQSRFANHVKDVVRAFEEFNPFSTTDLTSIGNTKRIIKVEKTITFVMEAGQIGKEKYEKFVQEKLVFCRTSLHEKISEIHPPVFKQPSEKSLNKDREKLKDAKSDSNTFCKLYIACESRDGDVLEFFKHENSKYPPSISEFGKLRLSSNNVDILECLTKGISATLRQPTDITSIIIHSSSLVNSLTPGSAKTMEQYCSKVFCEHIRTQMTTHTTRIDVIFDVFNSNNLSAITSNNCREIKNDYLIDAHTKIPTNFLKFLSDTDVRGQFFNILALSLIEKFRDDTCELYCTFDNQVLTNNSCKPIDSISPTSQGEAKTRLFLHLKHAVQCGHQNIIIRTEDWEVVVIALFAYKHMLPEIHELWIDYGKKKQRQLIPIHNMYELHEDKSSIIPLFHIFTGCHTTSSFFGIGKIKAWNTWMSFRDIDEIFDFLSKNPSTEIGDTELKKIEKFIMRAYDKSSQYSSLHECRRILFTVKNRSIEKIPPTQDALKQHILRAILTIHNWMQCLTKDPTHLDLTNYGWVKSKAGYEPLWTKLPLMNQLEAIISCRCKSNKCRTNCNCRLNSLNCTKLCLCQNNCR